MGSIVPIGSIARNVPELMDPNSYYSTILVLEISYCVSQKKFHIGFEFGTDQAPLFLNDVICTMSTIYFRL